MMKYNSNVKYYINRNIYYTKHQFNNKVGENANATIPLNITNSKEKTTKRTIDKVKMSIK